MIAELQKLDIKRAQSVEIKQYRKNRSTSQNKLYWLWLNVIADYTGDDPDDVHIIMKKRLLGTIRRPVMGVLEEMPNSTKKLTTEEFSSYLERLEQLCNLLQIVLPKPDDFRYAIYGEELQQGEKT